MSRLAVFLYYPTDSYSQRRPRMSDHMRRSNPTTIMWAIKMVEHWLKHFHLFLLDLFALRSLHERFVNWWVFNVYRFLKRLCRIMDVLLTMICRGSIYAILFYRGNWQLSMKCFDVDKRFHVNQTIEALHLMDKDVQNCLVLCIVFSL